MADGGMNGSDCGDLKQYCHGLWAWPSALALWAGHHQAAGWRRPRGRRGLRGACGVGETSLFLVGVGCNVQNKLQLTLLDYYSGGPAVQLIYIASVVNPTMQVHI